MKDNLVLRKLPSNTQGRDFTCGDIHGCYDLLMETLKTVQFDFDRDRLIAVGDLVDRGSQNIECLNLLYEPWFYSVLGNHEEMMFEGYLGKSRGDYLCWIQNGGLWHLSCNSTTTEEEDFQLLLDDCRDRLPLAYEVETSRGLIGIVHAEPPSLWDKTILRDTKQGVIWGRSKFEKEFYVKGVDHVYVGHTPTEEAPVTYGNITYMDSGSVWTNRLAIKEI